jgi:5-methylcytosine-specific restriction endonuclease McrA
LHPHHIQPFADHPELRWDVNNGMTLCTNCHALHTAWQNLGGLSFRREKRKKRKAKNSHAIRQLVE